MPSPEPRTAGQEFVLSFRVRTPTGLDGFVALTEKGGIGFTRGLTIRPTRNWLRITLPLRTFAMKAGAVESTSSVGPDPSRLEPVVVFGLAWTPKPAKSVVLELTRPVLERVVSSE